MILLALAWYFSCKKNGDTYVSRNEGQNKSGTSLVTLEHKAKSAPNEQGAHNDTPQWCASLKRPEWWLVILGFPTLIFLAVQAVASLRAANAAKDAAKAALLNAQAVINSERAWIEAGLIRKEVLGIIRYELVIRNYGKTPAQLSSYEIKYGPTEADGTWALETLEGKLSKPVRFFLGSGEPPIKLAEFDIPEMFASLTNTPAEVTTGFLCFTIHYADVVSAEPKQREGHKTCFVYEYNILFDSLERKPILTQYT